MRQSRYFLKTSKTFSEEDKMISAKLLKQAGYIRESVAGRYFILPIGQKVQQKIISIVKQEMDNSGAQEMVSPTLHPLELWKETNRTNTTGFELMKVQDRRGSEFALGGTAEEMFVDLVRKFEISYKDLPFHIYQFSTKFRDELRARGGLLRVREFIMKDGYSFHRDEEDFKKTYEEMKKVYSRIFERMGLPTDIVESDNGYIGGEYCHEFIVQSDIGESRYFATEDGSYAAHEDVTKFIKEEKNIGEALKEKQEVEAVRGTTMEDGVALHKLPLWQQIKDVLFVDENGCFVLAIIRGDLDVNETKLKHIIKVNQLRHASPEEISEYIDTAPGFISPVGIQSRVLKDKELVVVADDSLKTVVNMYGGANKKNRDLLNVNIKDYKEQINFEGDIAMARPGDKAENGKALVEKRGIEVGNIFQLGYHYTKLMSGANFTDADGSQKPYYMGCYGIGIGRTLAAVVEKFNDSKGIIWPEAVAPFRVHLLLLGKEEEVSKEAEKVYNTLSQAGVEVLFDDRAEVSAGEKFSDADLLGIPYRAVVSARSIKEQGIELKKRTEEKGKVVSLDELVKILK
ncbi:MAG: proline--tRNA ligase [bacterium]|nr:proline--tRNA ligase [bacterium]